MRTKRLIAWFAVILILAVAASPQDSLIIIRKGVIQRRVVYNAETRFTIQNKPGSIDDVIVGSVATRTLDL